MPKPRWGIGTIHTAQSLSRVDPFTEDFGYVYTVGGTRAVHMSDKYLSYRPCVMPAKVSIMPLDRVGISLKLYESLYAAAQAAK